MTDQTIQTDLKQGIATIIMARPEVRNAFDDIMIAEIHQAVRSYSDDSAVRIITITGKGSAFSAGGDISWMRRMGKANFDDNYQDAVKLAKMLDCIHDSPKPTIAVVNGPAIGGGTGLVAACDIAIGVRGAFFSFSEVKLGLVPACIAPYVINRVGQGRARELFITGRRIETDEAKQIGLLNFAVDASDMDTELASLTTKIMASGPRAISEAKKLVMEVPMQSNAEYIEYTARMIAELRTSDEGREGTAAFLEKRPPKWLKL